MFDIIKAIILGIIEGITEFLPISSTGHLIIANEFFSFREGFQTTFDIVIQFGAILSVVVYFWDTLFPFGNGKTKAERNRVFSLWWKVIIGVIPAVIIFGLFGSYLTEHLFYPIVVALALIIGGVIIIVIENTTRKPRYNTIDQVSYKNVFLIGLIQCLAVIPGTSRSASTIIGGMLLGTSRETAAEYSFFLAIPTMVGASVYSLYKSGFSLTRPEISILIVGTVTSFIIAYAVIAAFMKLIKRVGFKLFGYYRIILGLVVLLYFFVIK